ncbi:MAG: hypothetical protein R3324_16710, partial [Halobacteriales archaeon]|nr:hypothetical protein [Halobacteriales archaeon]
PTTMALHARAAVALALLLVMTGCLGTLPGVGEPTPEPIEAQLVGASSSGGRCVEEPTVGMAVESRPADGAQLVTVVANVTVPAANYVVDETTLTRTGPDAYRLDVNTTESDQKPDRVCPTGGVVGYEVTARLPASDGFELVVRHDGRPISAVGSGGEP